MNTFKSNNARRRNPVYLIGRAFFRLYILVGFLLRIVLMFSGTDDEGLRFLDVVRVLFVGVFADAGMAIMLTLPLLILYFGLNEWKYSRFGGPLLEILLAIAFLYSLWPGSLFHQYGSVVPLIASCFLGWKLLSFSLRFFIPRLRALWQRCSLYFVWGVYVFLFLIITTGEFFFWQEFGVRYNFIAVDYLVYTNEVIGNILESYAIVPLTVVLLLLTVGIIVWQSRRNRFFNRPPYYPRLLFIQIAIYAGLFAGAYALSAGIFHLGSKNQYVTQLEQNGAYDFLYAFTHNKLDYRRFYKLLPETKAIADYRRLAGLGNDGYKVIATADSTIGPQKRNIVLITVESLSASYLSRYGNTEGLTPQLDQLTKKGLVFDSLFACGNRTVRGLEALSLCVPPSAGESIIKQEDNRMGDLSVGRVLNALGYHSQFLYGGASYFDNMKDFFSHNGYEVIDRSDIPDSKITFSNVWGVCDEDIFNKALTTFDADASAGRPFFAQIMTTSNHRPFTYPSGRIKYKGKVQSREAAVKYTDYAIGKFINDAKRHKWFANTVFIVIADHCASSAGKTSLPLERYHIPCIVYAPSFVKPCIYNKVCSQIDVMPTVISLLGLRPRVRFAGENVLSASYRPRAFMATYQDLGRLSDNTLTVLSPRRKVTQYSVKPQPDGSFLQTPLNTRKNRLIEETQACYQYVNLYLPRKGAE